MLRPDVVTLLADETHAHGVHDTVDRSQNELMCDVRSVGMRETYEAMEKGFYPEFVLHLHHDEDYNREKACIFHGEKYRILRAPMTKDGGVDLVLARWDGA